MPSPPRQPAVALTFDLHNVIRSSVGPSEYSLFVLSTLFQEFMRCGNKICTENGRTNELNAADRQPEYTMQAGASLSALKVLIEAPKALSTRRRSRRVGWE